MLLYIKNESDRTIGVIILLVPKKVHLLKL